MAGLTGKMYPSKTRKKLSNYQKDVEKSSMGVQKDVDLDLINKSQRKFNKKVKSIVK